MNASKSVKQNLLKALELLLKPIIKLFIEQGISHRELSDTAKRVYVEMAIRRQYEQGRKLNRSNVSIVTGLTRKDVRKILEESVDSGPAVRGFSRPSNVLHGWYNEPTFTSEERKPLTLPFSLADESEPSFVNLVKRYSSDQSAVQMRDELLLAGAIEEIEQDGQVYYRPLRPDYEPVGLSPNLIERFGMVSYNVLSTLTFNVMKKEQSVGPFDRAVDSYGPLSPKELAAFDQFLKQEEAWPFLIQLDTWFSDNVQPKGENLPDDHFDTGLAIINYIVKNPSELKSLSEYLEENHLQSLTRD